MIQSKYDIIIVGGGTAGVSCAWNSAKSGLKTLLIEKNSFLGGSITDALVVPAMKTSDNAINTDFFDELYNNLTKINGAITYSDGNKGWFNPELVKIVLDKMLIEAGCEILFRSHVTTINTKNNRILSVDIETIDNHNINSLNNDVLSESIETKYLVDATGDAKIFQKLNCKFLENFENNFQPKSLRFIMSGINTEKFSRWLLDYDTNRDVTTATIVDGTTYLSTAYTWDSSKWALKPLFEDAIAKNILLDTDSNYFQLFSVAGTKDSIAFNAPRIIDSSLSDSKAYIEGRAAIFRLSQFCKIYLPGFEHAYISSIANSLGVRVSNRICGKYIYTYDDLILGKTFEKPVLISNYPVDIHSTKKDASILEKTYKEYQLPLESLISVDYENLFAIGRSVSAEFKAQAALRIIPSCFSMGEGLAKYLGANTFE